MAASVPAGIMSRDDVDESTLAEIAKACNTSTSMIEDVYECSPSQCTMVYETKPEIYQFVLSFGPATDMEQFSNAFRRVVSLHPILRTRIVQCRLGTLQVVIRGDIVFEHPSIDLERYLEISKAHGPWLGVPLLRSAFIGRKFVATVHHAAMDNWSWSTFLNVDVKSAYFGRPLPMRPPFKQFVLHCRSIGFSVAKSFWKDRFRGVPSAFPEARQPSSMTVKHAGLRNVTFAQEMVDGLKTQIPYFIEAAWAMTSSIYTGSDSIVYGYLISGRSSSAKEFRETLGPTIAEVPIQVDLRRSMTVGQLIKERVVSLRELQVHPAVHWSIEDIADVSPSSKIASEYQTVLNIVPEIPGVEHDTDVTMESKTSVEAPFPLHLIFKIQDEGLVIDPRFEPQAISEDFLNLVLNQFEHTLHTLVNTPPKTALGSLSILNPYDRRKISQWNASDLRTVDQCVHEAFRAQARARPEATAVENSDGSISYRKLDENSERIALLLRAKGVSRQVAVAVVLEPSVWAIIAMIGILKAGGICVLINPDVSYSEKEAICSRAKARFTLTSTAGFEGLRDLTNEVMIIDADVLASSSNAPYQQISNTNLSTDNAFLFFAGSGSVSLKEVPLAHGDFCSKIGCQASRAGWQAACRMSHLASNTSIRGMLEIWGTLLNGGCLCIADGENGDADLATALQATRANWAILHPSELRDLVPGSLPCLQGIFCMGAPFELEPLSTWSEYARLLFGWSPCEETFCCTIAEVTTQINDSVDVGFPVGCHIWIVNPRDVNHLSPIGCIGELVIEHPTVAKTHQGDGLKAAISSATMPAWASSFGKNEAGFYRTGHVGRYNPDGSVSLHGKKVNRVNIRGRTIQLEDVERTLLRRDEVRDIVVSTQISGGRTKLVAVVCLKDSRLPRDMEFSRLAGSCNEIMDGQLDAIKAHAASALPADACPDEWIAVERLPRRNDGNLDRTAARQWLREQRF